MGDPEMYVRTVLGFDLRDIPLLQLSFASAAYDERELEHYKTEFDFTDNFNTSTSTEFLIY